MPTGWRKVSKSVMPIARDGAAALGKAVEIEESEDGGGRIRFTDFGTDLLAYL